MSEDAGIITERLEDGSELVERGRYAVTRHPDGGITITRRVWLCDDCVNHDCGQVADPLIAPAMWMKILGSPARMQAAMKLFMRGGGDDGGT
jgi:hypothetical protein